LQRELAGTKRRIQELEQQLSTQETELSQARQEAGELRAQEQTVRTELRDLQAQVEKNRAPYVAMAATNAGSWDAYQARSGEGPAPQGGSSLVATLRQKLIDEREQRVRLERELQRLQAEQSEMSSGPFENKMQSNLAEARKQIEELKQALTTERKARQDLAHRYEQLQVELNRLRQERPAAEPAEKAEEIAALEARQQRVLASIERDLLVSRERETELRNALESSQGPDAVPLATAVSNLRAQNDALQTRLDDEHRHNRELSAKLNLAARVTDLIFKMRSANSAGTLPSQ
jgi:chromosome segregation ATPase